MENITHPINSDLCCSVLQNGLKISPYSQYYIYNNTIYQYKTKMFWGPISTGVNGWGDEFKEIRNKKNINRVKNQMKNSRSRQIRNLVSSLYANSNITTNNNKVSRFDLLDLEIEENNKKKTKHKLYSKNWSNGYEYTFVELGTEINNEKQILFTKHWHYNNEQEKIDKAKEVSFYIDYCNKIVDNFNKSEENNEC